MNRHIASLVLYALMGFLIIYNAGKIWGGNAAYFALGVVLLVVLGRLHDSR